MKKPQSQFSLDGGARHWSRAQPDGLASEQDHWGAERMVNRRDQVRKAHNERSE